MEKLSLIVAFTSPRSGIEAAGCCVSFPVNSTFAAEFAVMVNIARIAYEKECDSYDVGTTGKYESVRNWYSNIQTNKLIY